MYKSCRNIYRYAKTVPNILQYNATKIYNALLWPPIVIGRPLCFCPVLSSIFFFFYLSFFPRLISDVADWMSTILRHMVWPYCEFRT